MNIRKDKYLVYILQISENIKDLRILSTKLVEITEY